MNLDLSLQEGAARERAAPFHASVTPVEDQRPYDRRQARTGPAGPSMERMHMRERTMMNKVARRQDRQADVLGGALWLALASLAVLFAMARP